ncbi:MAG: metallophosphoesterase [Nitrospirota bacterium]|nr:metallophosphoesterase [Nitrospirota bacterium]
MSTYVVGDLHGQISLLQDLMASVSFDRTQDRLIASGDVIDRGADVGELLLFLYEGFREGWFLPVLGNHEETFLRFQAGEILPYYTDPSFGGEATLRAFEMLGRSLGRELQEWLSSWPLAWSSQTAIVVHASLPPVPGSRFGDLALCPTRRFSSGLSHECLELRPPDLFPSWDGRLVVSGHTIVRKAGFWSDSIALVDTGAYRTGVLSALCLETGTFHRIAGVPS